jgi:hypothetical protein
MDVEAVGTEDSGICTNTADWVAKYAVTSPSPLWVEES